MLDAAAALSRSLADPVPASPIGAAASWVDGALLGSVATALAVITVAALGATMLSGRVPVRRGITVVLGCFLLFGAPLVAAGLRSVLTRPETVDMASRAPAMVVPPPEPSPAPAPNPYDPYAGASVPAQR